MTDEQKAKENEVFNQELSIDDLDAAAGGEYNELGKALFGAEKHDDDIENCVEDHRRQIYGGGGFPNCAATVEDGSHCGTNDACYGSAIVYKGTGSSCPKAWK